MKLFFRHSVTALLISIATFTAPAQLSVVDDLERVVKLPAAAKRIVSLAPSITETLFAIGAGEEIIGVTDFCNYPPQAMKKQSVGGMINPNIETVTSLDPDLIVVSMEGNARDAFERFQHLKETIFVTNPRTLDGIYKSISDLAILSGKENNGKVLISSMKERAGTIAVPKSENPVRVLFVISLRPLIVVGGGTFLSELIELAGGTNTASGTQQSYPTFSREAVIAADPQVIIMTSGLAATEDDFLTEYPEWRNLGAVKAGKLFIVDSDLVSRPGPRVIEAVEQIASMLR